MPKPLLECNPLSRQNLTGYVFEVDHEGTFFKEETRITSYSGIVDILPTILVGLG